MIAYELKLLPEAVWAAITAGAVAALQLISTADPSTMQTAHFWLYAVGAGVVRAVLGAIVQTAFGKAPVIPINDTGTGASVPPAGSS